MYERAIVTFIDILGFRGIVQERSAAEVAKIVDVFRKFSGEQRGDDSVGLRVAAFSDSIVRSWPLSVPSGVFFELLDLLHAQGELIGQGVLVRGGVSFGEIAWEEDKVFGPGFIDAYDMESKFAVYPRIAVSPALLQAFATGQVPIVDHHDLAEEARYVRGLLAQGDDGIWYIDYLRAFRSELDERERYGEYLEYHKDLILGLAGSAHAVGTKLSDLALKANWLAKYHNKVVDELDPGQFEVFGKDKRELSIPADSLQSLFSFDGILPAVRARKSRTSARRSDSMT